jgi:hypothetical protein
VSARVRLLTVGAVLMGLLVAAPSVGSAQRVSVGVGIGFGYPVVAGGYYYRPWGPWGYPFYPAVSYPYPYPYAYPYVHPYPYYDPYASLRLQVTPRETEVFVDGYFAGIVDNFDGTFQSLDLAPGEHQVQLYLPGHRPVQQQLYLQPGKTSRVKLTMQPLAPGEPESARPLAQPLPQLPPPDQAAGAQPSRRPAPAPNAPVQTAPGADRGVEVNPAPPSSADYGSLLLRVQPGGANILIDGERWEGPDLDERLVLQVAAGTHVIEVQREGYRRYTTQITVKPGETTTLNVALTKNQ